MATPNFAYKHRCIVVTNDDHETDNIPSMGEMDRGITEFFRELPVQMIQVRNLNIDPDAFLAIMPEQQSECVGTRAFLQELHQAYPQLVIGSFSHYVEK